MLPPVPAIRSSFAFASAFALALVLAGCPRASSGVRADDDGGALASEAGSPPAPAPGPTCADLSQSFRTTWKQAAGTCATDAECGCYNPVVEEAGCGGVTDRATATTLARIERAFHAASCPWPHMCAAQSCVPHCAAGRCVNRPRTP